MCRLGSRSWEKTKSSPRTNRDGQSWLNDTHFWCLPASQHQSTPARFFPGKQKTTSIRALATNRKGNTPHPVNDQALERKPLINTSQIITALVEHVQGSGCAKWWQQDKSPAARRAPSSVHLMETVRCGATERRRMLSSAQPPKTQPAPHNPHFHNRGNTNSLLSASVLTDRSLTSAHTSDQSDQTSSFDRTCPPLSRLYYARVS